MNRTSPLQKATHRTALRPPVAQFIGAAVAFVPLLLWGVFMMSGSVSGAGAWGAVLFYGAGVTLSLRGLRSYPHEAIGLCNLVTLFRLMLVSALISALVTPDVEPWLVFAVASVALTLDGIDGWLARRFGHVSDFGATFDMEVDAVLALTLALLAYSGGQAGGVVILLGLPLYLFRLAQIPLPWLGGKLPERFSRKAICVMQIAVLIAILVPVTDRPLTDSAAGIVALALVWSFALDIRFLWHARA